MHILVTGGAGYIGSHTCLELLQAGYDVSVVDNLSNSFYESLRRVQQLAGRELAFYQVDLLDQTSLEEVFAARPVEAVIHFAGLKSVGESVQQPLHYYHNNLTGTINLCQVMLNHGVRQMVFSSSATVYGPDNPSPLREDYPRAAINPYGRTKLMIEDMLIDLHRANDAWDLILLRYFNPVGAHPSGLIGEDPRGIPNNLMPYITQVATGRLTEVRVFGNDYPTPDGTGIRDYIHVVDLALGHLKALEYLQTHPGAAAFNLGTGQGYSVLETIAAFEQVNGIKIPYRFTARRPGDLAVSYADPSRANAILKWQAHHDLQAMCRDAWAWQSQNPDGYRANAEEIS
jgi:UDP-glucose 4-epimerase